MSLVRELTALSSENKDVRKFLFERDFSTFYIHFFPLGNRQTVGKKTEDHTKGEQEIQISSQSAHCDSGR